MGLLNSQDTERRVIGGQSQKMTKLAMSHVQLCCVSGNFNANMLVKEHED